jgi:thiol-disulfide isomerase/thioredoxin
MREGPITAGGACSPTRFRRLSTVMTAMALVWCGAVTAAAQPGTLYHGRLEPEAIPTGNIVGTRLERIDKGKLPALPAEFPASPTTYGGQIEWPAAGRDGKVSVVAVEPQGGAPFACLDLDGDGRYLASECAFFVAGKQAEASDPEVRMWVPARVGPCRRLPLVVTWKGQPANGPQHSTFREIEYTGWVSTRGTVNIAGRPTLVTLDVSLSKGGLIDPRQTTVGIDANGNGQIDRGYAPFESTVAEDEDLVFKVGKRYVTVRSVDPATGDITVEERPASEYVVIDRVIGAAIPDFAFTDFDGRQRRLSDFSGKFVLLDFWGTWCGPCIGEMPYLKAAYEQLQKRGFEIVGIDFEPDDKSPVDMAAALKKARALVASHGVHWPQATAASTNALTRKRFRVQGFPTLLLIGPDGTLRSAGENRALRGENLLPTLEAMIPARR